MTLARLRRPPAADGIGLRKDKGGVNDPQFTEKFKDV